jgi:hypothetical protein
MIVLRSAANAAGSAFVMTFGVAFGQAVLLGLPLFLIFRSKGWVNVATCIIAGFAAGAAPAAVFSGPADHTRSHAPAATIAEAAVLIEGWVNDLIPPMYFGIFGALGGAIFWLVLSNLDHSGQSVVGIRILQSRMPHKQSAIRPDTINREQGGAMPGEGDPLCNASHVQPQSFTTRTAPLAALLANAA